MGNITSKEQEEFYDRADAFIDVANEQLNNTTKGKVSASMLYATARFNAYISAYETASKVELKAKKSQMIDFFLNEYRRVLEEHFEEYIENFDEYMRK